MLTEREAGFRRVLSAYKSRAKRKGIPWLLTDFECRILLTSACAFCGRTSLRAMNRHGRTEDTDYPDLFTCNGIDRLDPTGPYDKANCAPACWLCNRAKNSLFLYEFRSWLEDVIDHMDRDGTIWTS